MIALGVLAMSVGLIRSEAAPDLRTLTATGASPQTRRMITAATAAALGLLGAILGMAGAIIAALAWARSSLSVMFGDVPLADVLILLLGLPLIAAAARLAAGRPPAGGHRQATAGLTPLATGEPPSVPATAGLTPLATGEPPSVPATAGLTVLATGEPTFVLKIQNLFYPERAVVLVTGLPLRGEWNAAAPRLRRARPTYSRPSWLPSCER